jgi:nitrogen fixation NifU-like protein
MNSSAPELRDLYRELILDHARNPRHFGTLPEMTHHAEGINPLCGDKLHLYLRIDDDGRIADVAFEGSGCAISVASASLLTETVAGLSTEQAMSRFAVVIEALTTDNGPGAAAGLGKLAALQGVREYPSRVKCATLAWHALCAAINDQDDPATTE